MDGRYHIYMFVTAAHGRCYMPMFVTAVDNRNDVSMFVAAVDGRCSTPVFVTAVDGRYHISMFVNRCRWQMLHADVRHRFRWWKQRLVTAVHGTVDTTCNTRMFSTAVDDGYNLPMFVRYRRR